MTGTMYLTHIVLKINHQVSIVFKSQFNNISFNRTYLFKNMN